MTRAVFLIERCFTKEDSDGRSYEACEVDTDYGYFTSIEDARAFAKGLDAGRLQRYEEALAEIAAEEAAYDEELAAAKRLGYRPFHDRPRRWAPYQPDTHDVVEVMLHSDPGEDR